jgi:hypothetical protein
MFCNCQNVEKKSVCQSYLKCTLTCFIINNPKSPLLKPVDGKIGANQVLVVKPVSISGKETK